MILNSPYISGSSTITGNLTVLGSISGSTNSAISASYALNATSASYALNSTATLSSSYAATSSYADTFTVAGTLTAQKLVVQTITSSIVYSSGSNIFGNSVSNTQSMTGSVGISGSLSVDGVSTLTGALLGTSATFSSTAATSVAGTFAIPVEGSATNSVALVAKTSNGGNDIFRWFDGTTQLGVFKNSGNVGIGTTSPQSKFVASNGGAIGFEIDPTVSASVVRTLIYNRGTSAYGNIENWALSHQFHVNGGTEAMRITSGGNVEVRSAGQLIAYRSDNTRSGAFYTDNLAVHITSSTDPIRLSSADRIDFYTGATEKLRITSGGDLQLASGVATFTRSGKKIELNANSSNANVDAEIEITSGMNLFFKLGGSERMRISSNGGVQSTPQAGTNAFSAIVSATSIAYLSSLASTSDVSGYWQVAGNLAGTITHPTNTSTNYNTTSDYRLKENLVPLTNGLEAILALKPVTGNYINDETKTNMAMFLAHEVQEIVPIAVTGQKDAMKKNKVTGIEEIDIQQLDAAKLIPYMVKAIQELSSQIEELKALIK
jgi:hypothetical protein